MKLLTAIIRFQKIWMGALVCVFYTAQLQAQTLPAGFPVFEDFARRENLLGKRWNEYAFTLRPVRVSWKEIHSDSVWKNPGNKKVRAELLPWLNTTIYNSNRPFGWGNSSLLNAAGFQNLTSPGVFFKAGFLEIQLRPEFIYSQNKPYQGYTGDFSDNTNFARFRYWNFGDHPENFGDEYRTFATWGQSYISLNFGKIETGYSTQNIWWGPGQFSGLIFSNNARGMHHLFLKTSEPINIGIGTLESEIIAGRAEDSGLDPTQNPALNNQYFRKFSGDWRYVTGLSVTYQPKFLKGFFMGFNRTFQQYNDNVESSFEGRMPIFDGFQKERFFKDGNSVEYDALAQDQQVSVFFKFRSVPGKFEVYSEYGKHDHNFNWREFILNPEHARAFLIGFSKLVRLPRQDEFLQIRGEVIHQSESNNRYNRYPVLGVSNTSWHTHYQVRGFTNYGESMGAGIGVGANAQILEVSKIKEINRIGLKIQRIVNQQDFYEQAVAQNLGQSPWIDYSIGLLWDWQKGNLVLSSETQLIRAQNYQWTLSERPSPDFYSGTDRYTLSAKVNLIYLF